MSLLHKKNLVSRYLILALSVVMIWTGSWLYRSQFVNIDKNAIAGKVSEVMKETHDMGYDWMMQLVQRIEKNPNEDLFRSMQMAMETLHENDLISLTVFKDSVPVFWTDNQIPYNFKALDSLPQDGVVKLKNGWFQFMQKKAGKDFTVCASVVIRHDYIYRNRYLSNAFHSIYGLPESASLMSFSLDEGIDILDQKGSFLFSILLEEQDSLSEPSLYFTTVLILLGAILLIWFLKMECVNLEKFIGHFNATLLLVFSVGLLRYWSLEMGFPAAFQEYELFRPNLFAASFFLPSLGDFLINSLLIFYVFYFLDSRSTAFTYKTRESQLNVRLIGFFLFALIMIYGVYIGQLLRGLIEDSNIEFNTDNIFNLSIYSFIGFAIIGFLCFSFYLLCEFTLRVVSQMGMSHRWILGMLLSFTLVSSLMQHFIGVRDLVMVLWPGLVLFLVYYFMFRRNNGQIGFNMIVLLLLTFSGFSAHTLSKYTSAKEKKNREVLAEKLATDEDPLIEIDYSDMESKLLRSELLNSAFDSTSSFSKEQFEEKLEKEFFKGDWNNFDIKYYLFGADSAAIGLGGFAPVQEFNDLNKIIMENGIPSQFNGNMNFIYNSTEKLSYVIKLPVIDLGEDKPKGFLFCELRSKKVPEDIGFPELLMDKGSNKVDVIHSYSYARYVDSIQVNGFGSYRYSRQLKPYNFSEKFAFVIENDFEHLIYHVDQRIVLVLSRPTKKFINQATTFSYLFTLYCLIVITGFLIRQISKGAFELHLSLQGKVQFLLVGMLLISLVLFGMGTRYFIADQYVGKNNSIISEKLQSVRTEVGHKLGREKEITGDLSNYVGYILEKFSSVFLTDINLFGPDGTLIATSRPRVFQSGLISTGMDPVAFVEMRNENKSEFIQEEQIGNMRYLSGYVPLLNDEGRVLGYLNLPYFARQSVIETELSSFLVAILNIFVILFALSILAALFVSNWITKPLRLVQQSLATIQLGKTNKPIAYSGRDEIGSLVEEYNKKVRELEKYALELAKSERESAWREMAKQVAHEIKNPLTPMRLSLQHMQRSLRPEDPDFKEKLDRFSTTVIEQIDALSNIANEFSNFAKMPKAVEEVLDLHALVLNTVELYRETPDVHIKFTHGDIHQASVFADKDQLLRVLNNLVKNAIQAIPEGREGKIEIGLRQKADRWIVEVKDNGTGIPPDRIDKIFMPNFTTKSTGMGLGLAMVKNIVENAGGQIWFETSQNIGTTFYVSLLKHQD